MAYGTVNAEQITTQSGFTLGAGNASAFKNRVINGNMPIDQRNAGASVTVNGFTAYATDRFLLSFRPSYGTATGQQVSDAPAGFVNSLKLTQTSSTASNSSEIYSIQHKIEGYNIADLNWGTSNAKTVTISFWVKSSVTGTYGFTLQNTNVTRRSYVSTYTVNVANTWEQKTITIAGDTTGTWETTNSTGINILWDLGSGSDYQNSTLNAWVTANVFQATTGIRWIATSGATWQITGVQFEVGSTATSFDYRPYGTELALCQRYYYRNTAPSGSQYGSGYNDSTANAYFNIPFPVTMRTSPSALEQSGTAGNYAIQRSGDFPACTSVPAFDSANTQSAFVRFTSTGNLTAGQGSSARSANSASYLGWSAEL